MTICLYTATPEEIIKEAIFYQGFKENNRDNATIFCYIEQDEDSGQLHGAGLSVGYASSKGYYWNVTQFSMGSAWVSQTIKRNPLSKDFRIALSDADMRNCPRCGQPLYSKGGLHDFAVCQTAYDRLGIALYKISDAVKTFFYRLKATNL